MKKNIIIYTFSFFIIYFLFTNNIYISNTIISSSVIFIKNIFSTLFPMYIISKILINYNFPYLIYKITKNKYLSIFILTILSGSPNNAIIIKNLLNNNQITLEDANHYISCTYFSNPYFLYSFLSLYLNKKLVFIIITISYLSNIIIHLITNNKNNISITKTKELTLSNLLTSSIKEATSIFLNIYITIILFHLVTLLIPNSLKVFDGIFEISKGLLYLSNANYSLYYLIILSLIYINFGGLSILIQIKSIISDTNISFINYIYSRFYAVIISILIFTLIFIFYF